MHLRSKCGAQYSTRSYNSCLQEVRLLKCSWGSEHTGDKSQTKPNVPEKQLYKMDLCNIHRAGSTARCIFAANEARSIPRVLITAACRRCGC